MMTETFTELSHQLEETVGKPGRDALHKFFYPASNTSPAGVVAASAATASSSSYKKNKKRTSKARRNSAIKELSSSSSLQLPRNSTSSHDRSISLNSCSDHSTSITAGGVEMSTTAAAGGGGGSNKKMETELRTLEPPTVSLPRNNIPTTAKDNDDKEPEAQSSNTTPTDPIASIHRPRPLSVNSNDGNFQQQQQQPIPTQPPFSPTTFVRSFDVQEQEDQKYVEAFWTIYDDIIMLSLFTQLGVVARLLVSTWFTYFDGVFREDSALFTNLPLNCLSCFLLGLLGSGDRLMGMITTRFTPRNLQQQILQEDHNSDVEDNLGYDGNNGDDDVGDDDDDSYEQNVSSNRFLHDEEAGGMGLRRRRKRRQKRTKWNKKKIFHSWQPPLHWHDDLREVQLLALERRIRASKCLILFPVAKEDADVLEHYYSDEEYMGSARNDKRNRQLQQTPSSSSSPSQDQELPEQGHTMQNIGRQNSRRRFGRKKYTATNLADGEEVLQHGLYRIDSHEDDDDEKNIVAEGSNARRKYIQEFADDDDDDDDDTLEDDGKFRFDLKLTPSMEPASDLDSTQESPTKTAPNPERSSSESTSPAAMKLSTQKLIKRSPGISSHSSAAAASPSSAEQAANGNLYETAAPSERPSRASSLVLTSPTIPSIAEAAAVLAGTSPGPQMARTGSAVSDDSRNTACGNVGNDPRVEQIISNVQANVSENINRMRRVNIADGWDVGTTPESMADDVMLGLRDGFCGALSSFSSWNSSMLDLLKEGHVGEAFVGYLLGLQLPIVSYRFGQQVAVYWFIWRCRREARREERKGGYGIRIKMSDDDESDDENPLAGSVGDDLFHDETKSTDSSLDDVSTTEIPSVRAICTALFLISLVTQFTSLSYFTKSSERQIALSLLFSPFGSLARWRLSQLNKWRPGFPIGTFACNILACALSGSLGSLLAGNPGPKERILLQSFVAGFGGTLSSLAAFIVEVLSGMDPLLFRFDGVIYAVCSIMWALIVGFVFSASVDWVDETEPTGSDNDGG